MKIYTKKGDRGETFLFGGGPYPKHNLRIATYGEIDELNSTIGLIRSFLDKNASLDAILQNIQEELFVVGSELSSVNPSASITAGFLKEDSVVSLEQNIDQLETNLAPLKNFILPGGTPAASMAHLARTVCRRGERSLTKLASEDEVRDVLIRYVNRLSDFLFVLARFINHSVGTSDILWQGIKKK